MFAFYSNRSFSSSFIVSRNAKLMAIIKVSNQSKTVLSVDIKGDILFNIHKNIVVFLITLRNISIFKNVSLVKLLYREKGLHMIFLLCRFSAIKSWQRSNRSETRLKN